MRLALNAVQEEQFDYLLMLLKSNKKLERNEGGYEDFGDNNPKEALKNLISHLKENNPKLKNLMKSYQTRQRKLYLWLVEMILNFSRQIGTKLPVHYQKELKTFIKNKNTIKKTLYSIRLTVQKILISFIIYQMIFS